MILKKKLMTIQMNFFYSMKYIIALLLCMISILSCNTNKEISVKTNTIENDSITFYRLNDTIKISLEKNFNGGYEWFFEKNEIKNYNAYLTYGRQKKRYCIKYNSLCFSYF